MALLTDTEKVFLLKNFCPDDVCRVIFFFFLLHVPVEKKDFDVFFCKTRCPYAKLVFKNV